jgi:hypothetical protein
MHAASLKKFGQLLLRATDLPYLVEHFTNRAIADGHITPEDHDHFSNSLWFAEAWARSGFPQVTLGHRLAASLISTSVPSDVVNVLAMPWRDFVVQVPSGLIPTSTQNEVAFVRMREVKDGRLPSGIFEIAVVNREGWPIWNPHGSVLSDVIGLAEDLGPSAQGWPEQVDRAGRAALRLLVGVLVELNDPQHVEQIRIGKPARKKRTPGTEPELWNYKLTRDVKLDARKAVEAFVVQGTRALTVQSLVRGHWKRQPVGPGGAERKLIHIEPYWRGPEDAPIAVRDHAIKKMD